MSKPTIEEIEKHLAENGFVRLDQCRWLLQRVKELETDLSLNASMLARQCDLSREAETKANKYFNACNDLNERVAELEEGIEVWHYQLAIVNTEEQRANNDKELYKIIEEGR